MARGRGGGIVMSANIELERVAALLDETVDFVRINLQEGTLKIDGEVIGYAVKKRETQKNYYYVVDPIRLVKYIKKLREANEEIKNMEIKKIEG